MCVIHPAFTRLHAWQFFGALVVAAIVISFAVHSTAQEEQAGTVTPSAPREAAPQKRVPLSRAQAKGSAEKSAEKSADNSDEKSADKGEKSESGGEEASGTGEAPVRLTLVRPPMTAEQRHDWASRLREIYSLPPSKWPPPLVDGSVKPEEIGLLPEVAKTNPETADGKKEALGKMLFFDPRLSGSGQMACASCHDPELHWADGRSTAIGNHRKTLARNSPSIMNVRFRKSLFWDGRAPNLEDQIQQVLHNPDEMDADPDKVVDGLNKIPEYRELFGKAFGENEITLDRVAEALSAFERTIVGGRSRFDAFLKGRKELLTDESVIGLHLFRTEAHCMNCHSGPTFTDEQFHDVGLSYYQRTKYEDLGRYRISGEAQEVGAFKTPSLRNVANTGPYMHNGLFPLQGVLNLYNAGMPTLRRKPEQQNDPLFPTKSSLLHPLYFNSQDLLALKAFLESLNEPMLRVRSPELPGMASATAKLPVQVAVEKSPPIAQPTEDNTQAPPAVEKAPPQPPADARPSIDWTADSLAVVKENLAKDKAVLVDVRSVEEWKKGTIDGALFVPIDSLRKYSLNEEKVKKALPPKEEKKILYTYCVVGMRAKAAGNILQEQGYEVRPLKPGYEELLKAGFKKADPNDRKEETQ
jgi:cytochrome c peroxidase